jgi:predicted Fe-S protein YdhL (DUF1289 family)
MNKERSNTISSKVNSPCVNVCNGPLTDDPGGTCTGCYRTIAECEEWHRASDWRRLEILDVDRYDLILNSRYSGEVKKVEKGEFVLHEDYVFSEDKVNALEAENERLKSALFNSFYQQAGIHGATSDDAKDYADERVSEITK